MKFRGSAQAVHRRLGRGILLVVAGVLTLPASAAAQEWLRDRRNSEGPGIMLSDSLVFHPGIAIEGGYDTNVWYRASDAETVGSGRLRITPQLSLATLPPQRTENPDGTTSMTNPSVDFRLMAAAPVNLYLSADSTYSQQLLEQSDVGIQTTLDLNVFPRRTWSFLLRDTFTRTIDPGNDSSTATFNRDYNDAQLGIRWAPGGGAFEMNMLAGFTFNLYEEGGFVSQVGNYLAPRGSITGRWRFFPNTALTFETTAGYNAKLSNGESWGTGVQAMPISSSVPIRAWLGLNGQWTPVIATQLRIGYGAAFYDYGEDFDSALAQAEVDFIIGPNGRLKLGFIRDFVDSFFSNFYVRNEGYVGWDHLFSGVFLIGAKVGVSYMQYAALYNTAGAPVTAGTPNPRNDIRLTGTLFMEYRLKDWIGFNATVTYEQNFTDFRWDAGFSPPPGTQSEEYWKLVALAGVRIIY